MSITEENRHTKIKRHLFTKLEDQIIQSLYDQHGEDCWEIVQAKLNLKDKRSARDRYYSYLSRNSGPFSPIEDTILVNLYKTIGPKWKEIAKYLDNRSAIQVRNRYRSITAAKKTKVKKQPKGIRVAKLRFNQVVAQDIEFDDSYAISECWEGLEFF